MTINGQEAAVETRMMPIQFTSSTLTLAYAMRQMREVPQRVAWNGLLCVELGS